MKPYKDVSLSEAVDIISSVGDKVTVLVQGETGIGKSYMLKTMAKMPKFKDHIPLYLDCTTKEAGDLAMPKVKDIDGKDFLTFVPSKDVGVHLDKPVLLMIDEIGKATRPIQNVLCRLIYEQTIGDMSLAEGSVIFATTNLAEEGFGDNAPAYMRNRVNFITVRKPNSEEWVEWAIANDIHPTVMQTVSEKPDMLASYRDYANKKAGDQNPYIFDPSSPKQTFVTPRSLALASDLLKGTEHLPNAVRVHMLSGQIGEAGAMDMMAMNELYHKLPRYADIVKTPDKAKLPESAGAACMLVYTLIQNVEKTHVPSVMTYIGRMTVEQQALFCKGMLKRDKAPMISAEKSFIKWASENKYLFADNS